MKHFDRFLPRELQRKLRLTRRLEKTVQAALPPDYREHVSVGGIEDETLTLVVSSPAIASNLRFQAAGLQQKICDRHGIVIRQTRIRLSPPHPEEREQAEEKKMAPREISAAERESRERLRRVLKRL